MYFSIQEKYRLQSASDSCLRKKRIFINLFYKKMLDDLLSQLQQAKDQKGNNTVYFL